MSLTIQKNTAIAAINAVDAVQPLLQRMEEARHKGGTATHEGSAHAHASAASPANAGNDDGTCDASGASETGMNATAVPEPVQGVAGPEGGNVDVPPVLEAPGALPGDEPRDVPDEGAEFEFDEDFDDQQGAYIERMVSGTAVEASDLSLWPGLSLVAARADRAAARPAPTPAAAAGHPPAAQPTSAQPQNRGPGAGTGRGTQASGPVSPGPLSGAAIESPGTLGTAKTDASSLPPPVTAAGAALRALREADARAQAARAASAASATASAAGSAQRLTSTRTGQGNAQVARAALAASDTAAAAGPAHSSMSTRTAQGNAQVAAPEAGAAADGREPTTAAMPAMNMQEAAARHTVDAATSEAAQSRGETQAATQRNVQHVQQAQKTQEMLAQRARGESRVDYSFNSWGAGHAVVARQQGGHWTLQPSSTRVSQALGSSTAPDGVQMRLTAEGQGVDAALATDPDGRRRQQQEQETQ